MVVPVQNGKTQFFDGAGVSLALGTVAFYVPATTTPKDTWQDSNGTSLNTNPVQLDINGTAIIFGSGSYRQIVKDALGNTIWDQVADAIDPVAVTASLTNSLAAPTGSSLIGWIRTAAGAVSRTISAKLFGYVDVEDFGAVGDGATDDTDAWTNAIEFVKTRALRLRAMSPSYLVSTLTFDGSDYSVETNGCLFKQKSGLTGDSALHPIWKITGANIRFGDARFQGNIATDADEYSPAVAILSATNIALDNIYATDIRGDALYVLGLAASPSTGISFGNISGTNIYRNLLSIVGGDVTGGSVINTGPVGYRDISLEPNSGGTYQPSSLILGRAVIGAADITSDDATVINHAVEIGVLDADLSRVQATTPPYPSAPGSTAYALGVSRTDTVKIDHFIARNYNIYPINLALAWGTLDIGTLDIANCSLTETTFNALIVQQGDAQGGCVKIGALICDAAAGKMLARVQNSGLLKITVDNIRTMKCLIGVQLTGRISNGTIDINGSTGIALSNSSNVIFENVTTANDGSATFTSGCTDIVGINSPMFGHVGDGVDMMVGGAIRVAGAKVLGTQQPAIANGGDATTLSILAALRAHGLIAT